MLFRIAKVAENRAIDVLNDEQHARQAFSASDLCEWEASVGRACQ